MSTIGTLAILTKVNTAGLSSGLKKGEQHLQSFGDKVSSVKSLLLGFGAALGAGFALDKAKDFFGWGIKLAADAEQSQVAFEVLIGDANKAKKVLADLKQFSAKTPFEFPDVRQASQTLLNFGISAENVMPIVSRLGDIASGDAEKLKGLSVVFGQISSTGRMTGEDLNQLINAGFNPLLVISKKTGESMADLNKRMENGKVSAQEVTEAIVTATSKGGQFFGMSEKQSQTLAGRWSTLKDSIGTVATTIGQKLMPIAGKVVDTLASIVGSKGFSQVLETTVQYARVIGAEFKAIFEMISGLVKTVLPESSANWQSWLSTVQDILIGAEYGFTHWKEALAIAFKWTQLQAVTLYEQFKYVFNNIGQITVNLANAVLGALTDLNYNMGVSINNGLIDLVDRWKLGWNDIGEAFKTAGKWLLNLYQKQWDIMISIAKWAWEKLKNPFKKSDLVDTANFGTVGAIFNVASGGDKKEYRDIGKNFVDALQEGLPPRPLSPLEESLTKDLEGMESKFGKGFKEFWEKRKKEINDFQEQTEVTVGDITFAPPESPAQQLGKWLAENKEEIQRTTFNLGSDIKDWWKGLGKSKDKKPKEKDKIEIKQPELILKDSQEANKMLFDWRTMMEGGQPQDSQKELVSETKAQTGLLQDIVNALKGSQLGQVVEDVVASF